MAVYKGYSGKNSSGDRSRVARLSRIRRKKKGASLSGEGPAFKYQKLRLEPDTQWECGEPRGPVPERSRGGERSVTIEKKRKGGMGMGGNFHARRRREKRLHRQPFKCGTLRK